MSMKEDLPVIPLLVPKDYFVHRKTTTAERCHFVHIADQGLLHVVAEEPEDVLDVIDLEDMIGAKLVIEPTTSVKDTKTKPHVSSTGHKSKESMDKASNEPASDALQDTQGRAVLTIYSYPRQKLSQVSWIKWRGMSSQQQQVPPPNFPNYQRPNKEDTAKLYGPRKAHHRTYVLPPSEDLAAASALVTRLQQLARPNKQKADSPSSASTTSEKNNEVIILVNPTSGPKRNGQAIAETLVQPLLEQAGLDCILLVLEHATHALQLAKNEATIQDSDNDVQYHLSDFSALVIVGGDGTIHQVLQGFHDNKDKSFKQQHLAVGVVGCGTANGFAATLLHEAGERYGIIESILPICKGEIIEVDLSRYTTTNNAYTSNLTYTWAMVADIDIDSEIIHFMGEIRFDIWGVLRILWLRRYKARFSFLKPSKSAGGTGTPTMPALSDPVPSDWETIEDDFVLFWASQVSHASMNNFQSPKSRLDDGVFQIFIIRSGISKFRLFQILLGLEAGTHVNVPGVEFVECIAYRLEPLSPGSYSDVDGEVVESGPIQGVVTPGALKVFGKRKLE